MRQHRALFTILSVVTLALVAVIFLRKASLPTDSLKSHVLEGIQINLEISRISRQRWGENPVSLVRDSKLSEFLANRVEASAPDVPPEILAGLVDAVADFVDVYTDGNFGTLRDYRIAQGALVNLPAVAEHSASTAAKTETLLADITAPLVSKPRAKTNRAPVFAEITPEAAHQLGLLFTNRLAYSLINEKAMQAYGRMQPDQVAAFDGKTLAEKITAAVSNDVRVLQRSASQTDSIPMWEQMSSSLAKISVQRTNTSAPAWKLNRELLGGLSRDVSIFWGFRNGPDELAERDGAVWFAVFQTAIKPRGLDYFGPITACFFFNPDDRKWRLFDLACHSHIDASVPF